MTARTLCVGRYPPCQGPRDFQNDALLGKESRGRTNRGREVLHFVQHHKPGRVATPSARQNAAHSVECRSLPRYAAVAKTFQDSRGLAYWRAWQLYYLAFRRRFN